MTPGGTPGVSGFVLTSTGTTTAPTWQAGSGGGGSPGLFAGLMSATPTKSNTGLSTSYNQSGSFTATDVGCGILLKDTSSFGPIIEGLLTTYPSSPFTLTALFSIPVPALNFVGAGIAVADTTTGKAMWFAMLYNGGFDSLAYTFSAPGTFNSGLTTTAFAIGNTQPVWFRLQDDGTNIIFSCSYDGVIFTLTGSYVKSTSYLGSSGFNYIGPTLMPQNAPAGVVLQSWTITNP